MAAIESGAMLVSARDVRFLLEEWLDLAALTSRPRYAGQSLADYRVILEVAEQIAS